MVSLEDLMKNQASKKRIFAVLGAGKQGTAAAYDFLKFGNPDEVWMADFDSNAARRAVDRLKALVPEMAGLIFHSQVDARDELTLIEFLKPVHTLLSAVPYFMHPMVAGACIAARTNMCDLGGNTGVALKVHSLHGRAKDAGITIIPDCGLAPGLVNTLAVYGMEQMDVCREVQARCGGLPQKPRPPLDYKLVFAISGLTVEYFGKAHVIRDGKVVEVETFTELEEIDLPIGRCEAFVTSGGASTAPLSFEGKVDKYEYKTIRYPGHHAKFRVIKDLGLLDLEAMRVGEQEVVPREVFHAVAARKIDFPQDKDLVVVRVTCKGMKSGKRVTHQIDILDYHDDAAGFSAMERTTGFPAAIICEMVADGRVPAGVYALEQSIPGTAFMEHFVKRGIPITETRQLEM